MPSFAAAAKKQRPGLLSSKDRRVDIGRSLASVSDYEEMMLQAVLTFDRTDEGPPAWLVAVAEDLCYLLSLPHGWNSYGARPIQPSAIEDAANVLMEIMSDSAPLPMIVPTSRGGVQLEWHTNFTDVEITLQPNSQKDVYIHDFETGEENEGQFQDLLPRLKAVIANLQIT